MRGPRPLLGAALAPLLLAAPASAQGLDLETPDGAAAFVADTCPFESLEGMTSMRLEGASDAPRFEAASRDGFRSCELTLPGRGEVFHAEMAEAMSALLGERYGIDDSETLEDGVLWRWEPEEGLRGQAELSLEPTGDVRAIVSLERGELMENSE